MMNRQLPHLLTLTAAILTLLATLLVHALSS